MVLVSPGVEVPITDQSQYLPAPLNSVPFVLLATAQNKSDPTSTGIAQGTTAANAGKLFQVTSQRDLVTLYGNPFFYTTSNGTPIQGYELNEYGLLAAYSALGATNRIYCLRADIDLASLVGSTGRPTGNPDDGTYWLDTTTSTWGIYEFDATTSQFNAIEPIVITSTTQLSGSVPLSSIGNIGDYAVNAITTYDAPNSSSASRFFYKAPSNTWVQLGSTAWLAAWPTAQGTQTNPTLTNGNTLTIALSSGVSTTITFSNGWTLSNVASAINGLGWGYLSAAVVSGKLEIYLTMPQLDLANANYITFTGTGSALADIGFTGAAYNQPRVAWGTSAQQPLWQSGQSVPRPTGSVWFKVGSAGTGLDPVISQWNSAASAWDAKSVTFSNSDWQTNYALDSTGGKNIPAGSIYAQYNYDKNSTITYTGCLSAPVYYWERLATGPTVITGTNTAPSFTNGAYTLSVYISTPGSNTLSSVYTVSLADNTDADDFVIAWSAAGIPYTSAEVLDTGAIQLTHTAGGEIIINDFTTAGISTGFCAEAGFVAGTTDGVKYGPGASFNFQPGQNSSTFALSTTSGTGTGIQINVSTYLGTYYPSAISLVSGGSGYVVGDTVTIAGVYMGGLTGTNDLVIEVTAVSTGAVTGFVYVSGSPPSNYTTQLSNWVEFDMTANEGAPVAAPANNTNWFFSVVDEVDIMVNTSAGWKGYRNVTYDSNGFPLPSGSPATDPNGPIVSASAPTVQSDGTALVYGDIWIDTSDLENYPLINRWQSVNGNDEWVRIDNTDHTSSAGVVFADARWATSQSVNPADDPIPSIVSLLTSDYLDLDAPATALYPVGTLLFNTRRSGYNVKQYKVNYFNATRFPGESLPTEKDAWVSVSGLQANGAPYMGRKAQRAMVVQALKATIDSNTSVRDEDNFFNMLATPNYPELQPNMITLNNDRGQTGYIIGDTPMRLADSATAIQAWATNAAGATTTGEDGLVTRDTYLGLFYPSGLTNDLSGNLVAVPASHMMIRTFLRNDTIAYPWFAPAGTRRGVIDNAASIGYIDSTGEFVSTKTRLGIRDVLYTNQINPLVFFTGNGLLNYGNKNSFDSQSALDRTNVARLVAYVRRQLTVAARPFVFEPNDALTRQQISGVVETLMVDLVAKRGLYDYLVVCDESNNTPARIDRNELWVDVAIEPVKAVEFIYIPVRILNTGELAAV